MQKLYYIQNRGACGNSILWWRKEDRGYTTNLGEAETYTLEEAKKRTKRNIDRFWPKEYIDKRATLHVDMQEIDPVMSIRAGENF